MIQTAAVGVARADVGLRSAAHRVGAAIQPQAAQLLARAVTADAVVAEERLNVALEIDSGRHLRRRPDDGSRAHGDKRGEWQSHGAILDPLRFDLLRPVSRMTIHRLAACLLGVALVTAACSGNSASTPPPAATPAPSAGGSCSIPISASAVTAREPRPPKPEVTDDRRTRRGRVYEELWKHQAAAGARRLTPSAISPAATTEDIGQVAVMRDEGDLILPANAFDLRATAVAFTRNGAGGYDARRSGRQFESAVGEKIPLGDDDSAMVALPFPFAFYAGRYTDLFVNSDGNVTFVVEEHASTDRNVARFLTGPPRIAPVFDDLDPSQAGGVFKRIDRDALVLTWCDVPEFDRPASRVNVQLRLASDGSVDFIYGAIVAPASAVVGVSPGETGIFTAIDVDTVSASGVVGGGSGAVGERFSSSPELDFVALTRKFYETHGDDFDQLVLFTNTKTTRQGTFAFEFTVANEIGGIGLDVFDSSRDFGSRGRLRSVVDMDILQRFPDDPQQKFLGENNTLSLLGQECGHRWLAFVEFKDGATNSKELLGRDEAHWSFFFDSDASHMEGNDIEDLGNGVFRTVGAVSRYSALDQYVMGLRSQSDVPPMFVVSQVTSGQHAGDAPRVGVEIRGTRKDVRIGDVVAANGPRRPEAASAQKTFRQAFIYVVSQVRESSDELNKVERIRAAWETFFRDSTDGRGTMIARVR
jgi:hypothetical protein